MTKGLSVIVIIFSFLLSACPNNDTVSTDCCSDISDVEDDLSSDSGYDYEEPVHDLVDRTDAIYRPPTGIVSYYPPDNSVTLGTIPSFSVTFDKPLNLEYCSGNPISASYVTTEGWFDMEGTLTLSDDGKTLTWSPAGENTFPRIRKIMGIDEMEPNTYRYHFAPLTCHMESNLTAGTIVTEGYSQCSMATLVDHEQDGTAEIEYGGYVALTSSYLYAGNRVTGSELRSFVIIPFPTSPDNWFNVNPEMIDTAAFQLLDATDINTPPEVCVDVIPYSDVIQLEDYDATPLFADIPEDASALIMNFDYYDQTAFDITEAVQNGLITGDPGIYIRLRPKELILDGNNNRRLFYASEAPPYPAYWPVIWLCYWDYNKENILDFD